MESHMSTSVPPTGMIDEQATDSDGTAGTATPHDALLERLAGPGRLAERDLVMETGYSTAACRRLLDELESRGAVVRREVGTRTVVGLPEDAPAGSY